MFPDEKEALSILEYDKLVEAGKPTQYDLSPEQEKEARKWMRTGTRKATAYKFNQPKTRKPNATKGGIIQELAKFLSEASAFEIRNLTIPLPEGAIDFEVGDKVYSLTLTQHNAGWVRKKK